MLLQINFLHSIERNISINVQEENKNNEKAIHITITDSVFVQFERK